MITIHVVVAVANIDLGGAIMTEEGCKYMCDHFQGPVPIKLGPALVGKITGMDYNKETKEAIATIELGFGFRPSGQVVQALETPEGKRILAATLETMQLEVEEVKSDDKKENLDGHV